MLWTALLAAVLGLFLLKLLWNVCVPYHLIRLTREKPGSGISVFTILEVVLLAGAIGLAFLADAPALGPQRLAAFGAAAIVLSYVHMYLVGAAHAAWCWLRKRPQ